MEKTDNNNYVKIMGDSNKGEKINEPNIGKAIIHTMPKRYMATMPASNSAKSTGVVILLAGFVFLIFLLVFLYFYVLKKEPIVEKLPLESNQQTDNTQKKPEADMGQKKPETIVDPNQAGIETPSEIGTTTSTPIKKIDNNQISVQNNFASPDSDKDGLSDLEELLLGSSPNSGDTDGDGYPDALEVANLYDPSSRGYLIDSINVEEFVNEDYGFSFYVMSLWTVEKISGNDSLIIALGKDQYIQIITQDNYNNQAIEDWYVELFEVDEVLDEQRYKRGNWRGVIHNNGSTLYLEHPTHKHLITINYELGNDNTPYYKNIFNMMVRSISITD